MLTLVWHNRAMSDAATGAIPADFAAKRTRVAIFESYVFDEKLYGNARYIASIFKYLDLHRFEPVLISPVKNKFVDVIDDLGGRHLVVQAPGPLRRYAGTILTQGPLGKIATAASIFWYSFRLGVCFLRERIDIVQCHSVRAVITAGLAVKLTGRPMIWYIKGELDNPLLDRIAFSLADSILFQGETNMQRRYPGLAEKFRHKIEIVPNCIELDRVTAVENADLSGLKRELDIDDGKINIVFVGVLIPTKGVDDLLVAMAHLREAVPNVRLYVVGDHGSDGYLDYRDKLEAQVMTRGLDEVVFTGWRDDVEAVVSLMDIYVLPSHAEGVSTSAMEAMALGKAVLSTAVGSIPDLITNGQNGITVRPHAPEELAEQLIRLCRDPELRERLGRNARRCIFDNYSIQVNIDGLQRIYPDLI
ncbi:MAG: glycosyltransferase family 4 protein [Proteobacteria bacterium]|nr:glycosyltransferase family 4 protein [Pseudomonadota bacterium]